MNGNRIRPSRRDSAGGGGQSSSSKRRSKKLLTSRKSNDLFVGDEDEELPTNNRRGSSLHIDTNTQSIQQQYSNRSSRRKPKHASSAMKNVLQSKLSKSKSRQGAPSHYAQERKSNMNESISTKSTSRNSRNSRNKQRSTTTSRGGSSTKPTSNQQHSSSTDGRIDIIIGGQTNTSTKIQNTPKSTPRQIKPSYTTATSSSTNSSIQQQSTSTTLPPRDNSTRTQTDLQTRRRNPIQIIQTINSEDNIECDIPHLDSNIIDTSLVYTNKFRGSMSLLDIEKLNLKEDEFIENLDTNSTTSTNGTNREDEGGSSSKLGNNGWHRAINVITTSSTTNDISPRSNAIEISSPNNTSSTLDQLTVTHLLQNVHPQIDEYDAIYEEYTYLKCEIKALEKDRIELEKQFHEAGKVASQTKIASESNKLSYQTFRTNLRYMKSDDIKSLPVLWLEDVPLTSNDVDSNRRSNNKQLPYYTQLDTKFQQQIRNYRGTNLALLISDKQCKTSLIGRTCSLSNINTESLITSNSMLQREGSATLIDGGGELLNHVAITGYDEKSSNTGKSAKDIFSKGKSESSGGTTYFLKFDNGKTHHRGNLPSNLLARLYRERKDYTSIKYLSTGCTYSIGNGHRCYYCEFDTGECWWGTNKDDILDDLFMNVDVHRVAFGSSSSSSSSNMEESSSWIVIGKDGSVKWKNVPQGLHDLLMKHSETSSNSKEGLLSPSFSSVDHHPATPKSTAVCPCEVSLGIGGTYFIRFIDGSFDYSLPNFVADVVDKFESDGRLIRNVSLHMETHDCLIRYSDTEMLEY